MDELSVPFPGKSSPGGRKSFAVKGKDQQHDDRDPEEKICRSNEEGMPGLSEDGSARVSVELPFFSHGPSQVQ